MFVVVKDEKMKDLLTADGLKLIHTQDLSDGKAWFFEHKPSIVGKYSSKDYFITKKMFF
jgi:hypothetical protein